MAWDTVHTCLNCCSEAEPAQAVMKASIMGEKAERGFAEFWHLALSVIAVLV